MPSTPGAIKRWFSNQWNQEGTFILTVPTVAQLPASPADDGVFAWVLANERMYRSKGGAWVAHSADAVGVIIEIPKLPVPVGYLACDGSIRNIADYPDLGAYLGNTFGGNGTTTFGLPNYNGRVGVGFDSAQTEFDTLGETGGAKTHTLVANEIPAHAHTDTLAAPAHTHTMAHTHNAPSGGFVTTGGGIGTSAAGSQFANPTATAGSSAASTGGASATALTGAVGNQAGTAGVDFGKPHNNLPPYITVLKAIKT